MKEFSDKEWEAFQKRWRNDPKKETLTGLQAFWIFFFMTFLAMAILVAWGLI